MWSIQQLIRTLQHILKLMFLKFNFFLNCLIYLPEHFHLLYRNSFWFTFSKYLHKLNRIKINIISQKSTDNTDTKKRMKNLIELSSKFTNWIYNSVNQSLKFLFKANHDLCKSLYLWYFYFKKPLINFELNENILFFLSNWINIYIKLWVVNWENTFIFVWRH